MPAISLWRIPLICEPAALPTLTALLAPEEQARAARFRRAIDQIRFTIAHARLREILGEYLGAAPTALTFTTTPHGKPQLAPPYAETQFNLSHSGDWAAVAVTQHAAIGIDLEQLRPMPDAAQLVEQFFSPLERTAWRTLPPAEQERAFFTLWTRKEAWLKAQGMGLAFPTNAFSVNLTTPPRLLEISGDSTATKRWQLLSFDPAPGYVGAVAVARLYPEQANATVSVGLSASVQDEFGRP